MKKLFVNKEKKVEKMKLVVVNKSETEFTREVEDWAKEYRSITGTTVEFIDPETIDGEIFVKAHDIVQYPAILVLRDGGIVTGIWTGLPLPQFDEVSSHFNFL